MPRLQHALVSLLMDVLPSGSLVTEETAPAWLIRPGRPECLELWPLVVDVYRSITGLSLPESMPPRERRRLDAVITYPDGRQRVFEVDERQHFSAPRMITLDHYVQLRTAFSVPAWRHRCGELRGLEPGGGFARPRPPLFPEVGGRHRQRAFRDFLADAVPIAHGWLPTMRVSDDEARAVLAAETPDERMAAMLSEKARAERLRAAASGGPIDDYACASLSSMGDRISDSIPALWFEFHRLSRGTRDERKELSLGRPVDVQGAHDWVEDQLMRGGTIGLDVVVALAEAAGDDDQSSLVGIGPIEDLISLHGDAVVAALLERARRSPLLARALSWVSLTAGSVSDESLSALERYRDR